MTTTTTIIIKVARWECASKLVHLRKRTLKSLAGMTSSTKSTIEGKLRNIFEGANRKCRRDRRKRRRDRQEETRFKENKGENSVSDIVLVCCVHTTECLFLLESTHST